MYSRQEASRLKKEFWTVFGQYMNPVLSAEGEKPNWINYKTGEKDIFFRMHADNRLAVISIDIIHKDTEIQQIYFEHFLQFKNMLEEENGEGWTWELHSTDDHGKPVSRIYKSRAGLSIFNRQDWPSLISFFKSNIIALDEFWSNIRYGFETLR